MFAPKEQSARAIALGASSLAFMPDGRLLYADDDAVYTYDLATGRQIRTFSSPGSLASSLAPNPDGRRLALVLADPNVASNHI